MGKVKRERVPPQSLRYVVQEAFEQVYSFVYTGLVQNESDNGITLVTPHIPLHFPIVLTAYWEHIGNG
jgi:hypothetical protein